MQPKFYTKGLSKSAYQGIVFEQLVLNTKIIYFLLNSLGKTHLEVYLGGTLETQHIVLSPTAYRWEQTDMDIRHQLMSMLSILLVTATILRSMFHQFLTNMVVIWLHLARKVMLSRLLTKVEVGTNLVDLVGDSHQSLTKANHGEVTLTLEEGILVINIINVNNNNGMAKVGPSIITHEGMVVNIIINKVVTATAGEEEEQEAEEVIIMIKAGIRFLLRVLDIDIKHNGTTPDSLLTISIIRCS